MAPHSSTLAWKIPWMEEPGRLQSMGWLRVGHNWVTSLSLSTFMHWRRKWKPTPVFLPGESQGQGSLVGCRLWGRTIGHDWSDLAAAAAEKGKSHPLPQWPSLFIFNHLQLVIFSYCLAPSSTSSVPFKNSGDYTGPTYNPGYSHLKISWSAKLIPSANFNSPLPHALTSLQVLEIRMWISLSGERGIILPTTESQDKNTFTFLHFTSEQTKLQRS